MGTAKNDASTGYRLLDHGEGRKLESFGGIILDRPAPQATGPRMTRDRWREAHARFARSEQADGWERRVSFEEPWRASVEDIVVELALSPQGQVGLFPEQASNWRWLRDVVGVADRDLTLLNAFAYTGGATLAALAAPIARRVEVCHVDGAKSAVAWARRNAALNGKAEAPVRWIVDDVLTFLRREVKRGRRYDGIVLDPPAFGRGPDGKRWRLADDLPELFGTARALLSETPLFLLFSCHDPSLTPDALRSAVKRAFGTPRSLESVSLAVPCDAGPALPAGTALRFFF